MLSGFCPASFELLFCSAVLGCRKAPLTTGPCSQWCQFFNCGCVWAWPCTSSICGSIMYRILYKIKCNPMHLLYGALPVPYVPVRVTRIAVDNWCTMWSHIGTLMRLLAAEPSSTAGLLLPCQYLCGPILVTPYSMMWDWRVSRAGPMPFYWSSCSLPFCLVLFSLSHLSFYGFVLWGWGLHTDTVLISLPVLHFQPFSIIIIINWERSCAVIESSLLENIAREQKLCTQ